MRRLLSFTIVSFLSLFESFLDLFPRLFFLLFAELFFFLCVLNLDLLGLDLVINQVVQRDHRANECAHIYHMHLIVGLNGEILDNAVNLQVGQQVKDVLEIVDNRGVVSKFA